ncbi:hypothetical protein H0H92_008178 [Tricholoma furcatifolium]|nr:hypothetical protein H0H92_008178 [Tricholoma furcatifolium]
MRLAIFVLLGAIQFSFSVAAHRNASTIPLAKRSSLTTPDGVVRVDALRSEIARTTSKIQRGFEVYERNTGTPHPNAGKSHSKRGITTSIPLTDYEDVIWYGSISVGTPARTFTVQLDTGSSDLFLPGSSCTSSACRGHSKYNASSSASSKSLGREWSIAFADYSRASGELYSDVVAIGGSSARSQTVGAATEYSGGFDLSRFPADGLLGMAFRSVSRFNAPPFLSTLYAQGQLSVPQVGFKLADEAQLTIGGIDFDAIHKDTLVWTPVTIKAYYQIALGNFIVNGAPMPGGLDAIIDTGTSFIYGSSDIVAKFYAAIPGAKHASETIGDEFYTYPCNAVVNATLVFNRQPFAIKEENFNLGLVALGSSDCVGGVVIHDNLIRNTWLLGDVFLKGVYSAFEFEQGQVGFAQLK